MAMKLHTLDEMTDRYIGPVGTPKRDISCWRSYQASKRGTGTNPSRTR